MDLAAAKQQGFVPKHSVADNAIMAGKRLMAVIGIMTEFGHKSHRDSIRKSWMPTGIFHSYLPMSLSSIFLKLFVIFII